MRIRKKVTTLLLLLAFALSWGCAKQEEPRENLHLMAALRTAISAKNAEWLAKTKAAVDEAIAKDQMSEETSEQFNSIIETATSGDWAGAENMAIRFQKSRRPGDAPNSHSHTH